MTKGFESFRRCSVAIKLYQTPFLTISSKLVRSCATIQSGKFRLGTWWVLNLSSQSFHTPTLTCPVLGRNQCCTWMKILLKIGVSYPDLRGGGCKSQLGVICGKDLVLSYRASTIHGFARHAGAKVACVMIIIADEVYLNHKSKRFVLVSNLQAKAVGGIDMAYSQRARSSLLRQWRC